MAEVGALVKNYLDEPLNFYVRKRDGAVIKGELKPNSHVDVHGLKVGDDMHLWNDRHAARHVFQHTRNAKYIVGYPHMKREIDFAHRGYYPILVTEWDKPAPAAKSEPTSNSDSSSKSDLTSSSSSSDNKIFIISIVLIIIMGIALLVAVIMLFTRKSFAGSGETPSEIIFPESIFI